MIYLILVITLIVAGIVIYIFRKKPWVKKLDNAVKSATGQKVGYDRLEPVMPNQPKVLPTAYKTPKGAIVHSDTPPTETALRLIDNGITRGMREGFKINPQFNPPDALAKGTMFRNHNEYRFLLLEPTGRTEVNEPLGAPLLRTWNSATGYASGITAGFELINWKVQPVFPITFLPKPDESKPEYLKYFEDTVRNEVFHWVTANDDSVFMYYKENDDHSGHTE